MVQIIYPKLLRSGIFNRAMGLCSLALQPILTTDLQLSRFDHLPISSRWGEMSYTARDELPEHGPLFSWILVQLMQRLRNRKDLRHDLSTESGAHLIHRRQRHAGLFVSGKEYHGDADSLRVPQRRPQIRIPFLDRILQKAIGVDLQPQQIRDPPARAPQMGHDQIFLMDRETGELQVENTGEDQ